MARWLARYAFAGLVVVAFAARAGASTYVVYMPLDSSIYNELETLNGLGYLDTYLDEIKPISRVEAARLTLEAESNLSDSERADPLARNLIDTLRAQLREEVGWLENNSEDDLPTMAHPLQRLELQYVYSDGSPRRWRTSPIGTAAQCCINAEEGTPLLPNDNGLPTESGSNEVASLYGWVGAGGFLTGYGDVALAGPLTRNIPGISRLQPISAAAVASFGNLAISFGMEQMWWGVGYFNSLSQGNNASSFPALRLQNIHPHLLPWFLRYLGQFRTQFVFGQMDDGPYRYYYHPYLFGQNFTFKPLPSFELGLNHTIMFAGRHNNNYGLAGFLGRATGFATGNPADGNTHSRGGLHLRIYFQRLRNSQLYFETMGNDNLAYEVPGIGRALPFLSVSYLAGVYVPRLTKDGLTDLRFEFEYTDVNEEQHDDSLYWAYEGQLMGTSLGPNATEVDLQVGRWLTMRDKLSADFFYTEQAPSCCANGPSGSPGIPYPAAYYPYPLGKEHSGGLAFDFLHLPRPISILGDGLATIHGRAAVEYARDLNYKEGASSVRFLLMFSGAFTPGWPSWEWK